MKVNHPTSIFLKSTFVKIDLKCSDGRREGGRSKHTSLNWEATLTGKIKYLCVNPRQRGSNNLLLPLGCLLLLHRSSSLLRIPVYFPLRGQEVKGLSKAGITPELNTQSLCVEYLCENVYDGVPVFFLFFFLSDPSSALSVKTVSCL